MPETAFWQKIIIKNHHVATVVIFSKETALRKLPSDKTNPSLWIISRHRHVAKRADSLFPIGWLLFAAMATEYSFRDLPY